MLKFYNTLSKSVEDFTPLNSKKIKIYICGPTVYSLDHLGHARVGVFYDSVRRYFQYLGFRVKFVQNITDVGHLTEEEEPEDKIIKAAQKEGKSPLEIARYFEKKHFEAMEKLNILKPDFSPRASENIDVMIEIIKTLIDKDFAYETKTGIYFDVKKIKDYGKLSGRMKVKDQFKGSRINLKEDKKDPQDFALWVKAKPGHLLKWTSPWGEGYPGWHIECSAMIKKFLDFPIDIHGGGNDLIFPHHENERAQGIGFSDKEPVRYYLHLGQVKIAGKKMSKSLGNVVILEDLEKKYPTDWIRLALLLTNYSKPLDFSLERIKEADKIIARLSEAGNKAKEKNSGKIISKIKEAIEDNFNFAKAIAIWDEKRAEVSKKEFADLKQIFGLNLEEEKIPQEILEKALERQAARQVGDFKKADKLRQEILSKNYVIEDSGDSFRIKRKDEV